MISWKSKKPNILDTKIVKKFAWLPILIDGVHYWLGNYYVKYRYQDGGYYNTLMGAMEGCTHHNGKPFTPRDRPSQWGSYAYGGTHWEEQAITLHPDDLPVYEVDNFYSK